MTSFDERARDWDTPDHIERSRAIAAVILDTLRPGPTTRVLELGAGTGLLGLSLLPSVAEVVLTDASRGMLDVADAKIATGAYPGARTLQLDLNEEAVPEERFDLIVSLLTLHHVLDTAKAVRTLAALLATGGRIALADLETEDGSFHTDPTDRVLHGFDRGDLQAQLEAAGFREVAFRHAYEVTHDERAYPLFLVTATRA